MPVFIHMYIPVILNQFSTFYGTKWQYLAIVGHSVFERFNFYYQ
jgi:hypothetical protein